MEVAAPVIEVRYKTSIKMSERPKISNSEDAYNMVGKVDEMLQNLDYKELFYAIYLNQDNRVLACHKISEGSVNCSHVDIKFIMQGAIMTNASALIICHNHPSGNLRPSKEDIKLTKRVRECSEMFGVRMLDSIVISSDGYYSLSDNLDLI